MTGVPRGEMRLRRVLGWAALGLLVVALLWIGDPREFARARGARQWLSVATGGTGGVWYPYGGGIAKVLSEHVANVQATAEVTSASIDNLNFLRAGTADIAFTLADALDDAYRGTGPFAETGRVPARALAVLYGSYVHLATTEATGIGKIDDLRGRVVSTGSPGSGTEAAALRILEAAGLDAERDLRRQGLGAGGSVDATKDGKIDAFFWVGGVPTGAVLDLANTPGRTLKLIPLNGLLPALRAQYGEALYTPIEIPGDVYPGLRAAVPTISVANVLVVDREMSDQLAYEITRAIFDHRDELIAIHPEASNLTPRSAVKGSPVPFHPGAIRFYREQGVWGYSGK